MTYAPAQGTGERVGHPTAPSARAGARHPGGSRRGGARRAALRLLAGLALAVAVSPAPAQETVPVHWIAYARTTGSVLQERLGGTESDPVARLHAWLERRQRQSGEAPRPVVRIWISPSGWVERSEFDSLGDAQADADLRAILSAAPLPEPPPADMRQPLVLQLALQPNPDYEAAGERP